MKKRNGQIRKKLSNKYETTKLVTSKTAKKEKTEKYGKQNISTNMSAIGVLVSALR